MTQIEYPRAAGVLPAELTRLIGRDTEVAEVKDALTRARLVTLLGVGGVGKTRVALRVAHDIRVDRLDGVWFVELSALHDPDLLTNTVAAVADLPERTNSCGGSQLDALISYLYGKRLLLVLDTCEHLIDSCARFAQALLQSCPDLRILATSREPLRLPGECVLPVLPLPAPDPDDADTAAGTPPGEPSDAMLLFAERSAAVVHGFRLTDANRLDVARLCHRLDGIPLAIELAVVRLRALPLEQLLERLDDRFRLLSGGNRTAPARHQTLRTAIDWSYQLCSQPEQLLWQRLSVFAGEFELRAVEEICSSDELPREEVLEHLTGLLDKAIVLRAGDETDACYRMLDTIREYGLKRLAEADEERVLRRRHRDHFRALAARFAPEWLSDEQMPWIRRLRRELPNLRAALEFCGAEERQAAAGLEMATSLWGLWLSTGRVVEGQYWLDRLLPMCPDPTSTRMWALTAAADLALMAGQRARGAELTELAADLAETFNDGSALAYVAKNRGLARTLAGDNEGSLRQLCLARERFAALGERGPETWVLTTMCGALGVSGHYERSLAIAAETPQVLGAPRERWMQGFLAWFEGLALWGLCRHTEAEKALRCALTMCLEVNHIQALAYSFDTMGWVACATGHYERAATHLGTATTLWDRFHEPRMGIETLHQAHNAAVAEARNQLGDVQYDKRFTDGAALPLARAVALAVQPTAVAQEQLPAWSMLTPREREIATLVAEGLSNRRIAERLVISKRTVDSHVEHIRCKLGYTSRTQIAVLATAHIMRG